MLLWRGDDEEGGYAVPKGKLGEIELFDFKYTDVFFKESQHFILCFYGLSRVLVQHFEYFKFTHKFIVFLCKNLRFSLKLPVPNGSMM